MQSTPAHTHVLCIPQRRSRGGISAAGADSDMDADEESAQPGAQEEWDSDEAEGQVAELLRVIESGGISATDAGGREKEWDEGVIDKVLRRVSGCQVWWRSQPTPAYNPAKPKVTPRGIWSEAIKKTNAAAAAADADEAAEFAKNGLSAAARRKRVLSYNGGTAVRDGIKYMWAQVDLFRRQLHSASI